MVRRPSPRTPASQPPPLAVAVHIVSAVLFMVLGAFQFAPKFRAERPGWHRASGQAAVVSGLAVAVSAVWTVLFYEGGAHSGELVRVVRLVFGSAMAVSILLGVAASAAFLLAAGWVINPRRRPTCHRPATASAPHPRNVQG